MYADIHVVNSEHSVHDKHVYSVRVIILPECSPEKETELKSDSLCLILFYKISTWINRHHLNSDNSTGKTQNITCMLSVSQTYSLLYIYILAYNMLL